MTSMNNIELSFEYELMEECSFCSQKIPEELKGKVRVVDIKTHSEGVRKFSLRTGVKSIDNLPFFPSRDACEHDWIMMNSNEAYCKNCQVRRHE